MHGGGNDVFGQLLCGMCAKTQNFFLPCVYDAPENVYE